MSFPELFGDMPTGKWGIQQYLNDCLGGARQKNLRFNFHDAIKYYLHSLNTIKDAPGSHGAGFAQMLLDNYHKKVRTLWVRVLLKQSRDPSCGHVIYNCFQKFLQGIPPSWGDLSMFALCIDASCLPVEYVLLSPVGLLTLLIFFFYDLG